MFCRYIKESLAGLELHQTQASEYSRADGIAAIRYRTESRRISRAPPARVEVLQQLLGDWPALTHGGARYLHQVRFKLLEQFSILKETPGAQEELFFSCTLPHVAMVRSLLFARDNLETVDWRAPETENRSGLALHRDFSSTFVSLDSEQLLQRDGVTPLHRLVKQKPVRERLQEWIRLHPRGWRQLIRLMEQRLEYIPVFQHVYEHLRLTYIRTTGDLDTTLSSIEDDISRGNVVLETQLEDAVEAAEAELRMRSTRLEQFRALKAQGPYINRRGWNHVILPTSSRPINYIPRDRPLTVGKRKRGGEPSVQRKRPRVNDPEEAVRKRAILAPSIISRPDLDPEVPLESGEHPSCWKAVGKATVQKMAREALAEHKYRLNCEDV